MEKKKVKWNSDVEESESQAAWGGARRDMAVVREKLWCKHDVSEFYSPPRVVKMARKLGMRGAVSLDLTVPASDGASAVSTAETKRWRLFTYETIVPHVVP